MSHDEESSGKSRVADWAHDPDFPWVQELLEPATIGNANYFKLDFGRRDGRGTLSRHSPRMTFGERWPTLSFYAYSPNVSALFDAGEWLDVLTGTTIARQYLTIEEQQAAFDLCDEIHKLQLLNPLPLLRRARDRWVDALGNVSSELDTPRWPLSTAPSWVRELDYRLLRQGFTRGWTVHGNLDQPIGCVRQRGALRVLLAVDIYGPQLRIQSWPKLDWLDFSDIPAVLGLGPMNPNAIDPDTLIQLIECFHDLKRSGHSHQRMVHYLERGPLGAATGPWHNQNFYRLSAAALDFQIHNFSGDLRDTEFWTPRHHTPETLTGGPHNQLILQPDIRPDELGHILRYHQGFFISDTVAEILRPTIPDAAFVEYWAQQRKFYILWPAGSSGYEPMDPNRSYLAQSFGRGFAGTALGGLAIDPTLTGRPGHTMGKRDGLIVSETTAHAINTATGTTLFEPAWNPDSIAAHRHRPNQARNLRKVLPSRLVFDLDTVEQRHALGIQPLDTTRHNPDVDE